jgi:hypothetical protein
MRGRRYRGSGSKNDVSRRGGIVPNLQRQRGRCGDKYSSDAAIAVWDDLSGSG